MFKHFLTTAFFISAFSFTFAQQPLSQIQPDVHYREGIALLGEGKFVAASEAFKSYLGQGKDPVKRVDAEYYIAYCAVRLQNDDGEALIAEFIRQHPDNARASLAYFELGDIKYRSKQYDDAIRDLNKLDFDQLPDNVSSEARFKLGYSYFTQKKFDKAYEQFNEVKKTENDYQFPASYYAGYINFEKGEYDRAYYDFKRAEKNKAYASVVPSLLVKVLYKQGKYDELIRTAESALNDNGVRNKTDIYLYLGEAYYQKKNYANAAGNYDKYLKANRTKPDRDILYRIADTQQQAKAYDGAIDNFKQVALVDDTLGQYASYQLGNLYLKTGNKAYALAAFKKASESHFNQQIEEEAFFKYAKLNFDLGNFDDAVNAIISYKEKYPQSDKIKNTDELLTQAYLNTKNYDAAIAHFEKLKNRSDIINRAYQKITFYKGTELFNDGQYYQAVQMFNKSLQYPFDNNFVVKANFWNGEAYSIGRKYEEAVNAYAAVFRADPDGTSPEYLKARYGIGYAYFNQQDYEKALGHFKYYTETLERQGKGMNYGDALVRLGDCYYATKNYDLALATFDKVINNKESGAAYAFFREGVINGILGNLDAANNNFDKVINYYKSSPYVSNAVFQKGQFNFEKGNYQVAITYFDRVIKDFPQSNFVPYALQSRAIANTNLKNYQAAANDYERIISNYPTHEVANSALLSLQQVLANLNRSGDFDQYMAKYKNANPQSTELVSIEYEAAKTLYFNQKYDAAIRSLQKFIGQYPESATVPEARYYLADAYYRNGQPKDALEQYYQLAANDNFDRYNRVIQRIAELEYAQGNTRAAIGYDHRLEKIATNKKEQYTAWRGLMLAYYQLQQYDSVDVYAENIVTKGQVAANSENEATLYLGKSAYARKQYDQALDYFLSTVNSAKDENGAEAQYLIASIYHDQGNFKKSNETLFSLNSNYSSYDQWLGKSFLLIADNFLAMDEAFQAKATLESVIKNSPVQEIKETARQKLEAINQKSKAEAEAASKPDTLVVDEPEKK